MLVIQRRKWAGSLTVAELAVLSSLSSVPNHSLDNTKGFYQKLYSGIQPARQSTGEMYYRKRSGTDLLSSIGGLCECATASSAISVITTPG